jgi:hypothetical protein
MMSEAEDALARKAASDALGHPVTEDMVTYALALYAADRTEDLVDRLAALAAGSQNDRHVGRAPASEMDLLKIVLAVRAAVPTIVIWDEIEINAHRWLTREALSLTVSLECLERVLAEECPALDQSDVARLITMICWRCAYVALEARTE